VSSFGEDALGNLYIVDLDGEIFKIVFPGDTTGDGNVNVFDLATLANHYALTGDWDFADGDFDGDDTVGIFDLAILATHYGTTSAAAPVPEPTALALAALALMAGSGRRRGRQRRAHPF